MSWAGQRDGATLHPDSLGRRRGIENATEPPRIIQERLGHSSWATTMDTYGHILEATDDGVTGKLDGMFRPSKGALKPAGD